MKQITFLITLLALFSSFIKAQPLGVEPFADAIPYRKNISSNLFLSNHDASAVKMFFTSPEKTQPQMIMQVDEGYYHGYRLCYNSNDCSNSETSLQWIQVLTINTEECIKFLEKNNPGILMVPFWGISSMVGKKGHTKSDFKKVCDYYRHLPCRLYQQTTNSSGDEISALSQIMLDYKAKIGLQTEQLLASEGTGLVIKPKSNDEDYWDLWMQCLDEVDDMGYITLIEYSENPNK